MFSYLVDPVSGKSITKDDELTYSFNEMISKGGKIYCKDGSEVDYPVDCLLVSREDGICYMVRRGIPIMLVEKQIEIKQIVKPA